MTAGHHGQLSVHMDCKHRQEHERIKIKIKWWKKLILFTLGIFESDEFLV